MIRDAQVRRQVSPDVTRDALIVAVLQLLAERHSAPHPDADTEARHMRYMEAAVDNAVRNHAVMLAEPGRVAGEPS